MGTYETGLRTAISGINLGAMEFCYVPAGAFVMGSFDDEALNAELPLHEVNLPYHYWLARFPVTRAQYAEFVHYSGYDVDLSRWANGRERHPASELSWYDAQALARWLNDIWRMQGVLRGEWRVVLPSEAEWEKAARGGMLIPMTPLVQDIKTGVHHLLGTAPMIVNSDPARRFPWGERFESGAATVSRLGINRSTPVGSGRHAESPYGCLDMAGNVWEWTRSTFAPYPYVVGDGREKPDLSGDVSGRVLRGGSYRQPSRCATASFREWLEPLRRNQDCGVRLALVPESVAAI
jgi:formylglycine-generating enzyme required for sulfatase activity